MIGTLGLGVSGWVMFRPGLRYQARALRAAGRRRVDSMALAYLDLDGFTQYNDAHGHAAGDALLVDVVAHLQRGVRAPDLVARVGADEFVVVLSNATQSDADRILGSVCSGMPIACSHGVAGWPHGADLEDVMHVVDALMYAQKQQHHAQANRGGSSHDRRRPDVPRSRT